VLPVWQGPFSQYVPGQSAVGKLSIVVPPMAQSMQAWEVSPGDVRHLKTERVVGGTKVTLFDFGLTSAIVFTSNTEVVAASRSRPRRRNWRPMARDMAAYELEKVSKIEDQLERQGHTLPDSRSLIEDAQRRLKLSKRQWENQPSLSLSRGTEGAAAPAHSDAGTVEKAVRGMTRPSPAPTRRLLYTAAPLAAHGPGAARDGRQERAARGDFESVSPRPEDAWRPESPPAWTRLRSRSSVRTSGSP